MSRKRTGSLGPPILKKADWTGRQSVLGERWAIPTDWPSLLDRVRLVAFWTATHRHPIDSLCFPALREPPLARFGKRCLLIEFTTVTMTTKKAGPDLPGIRVRCLERC